MNRTLGFCLSVFFATVGIALIGGEQKTLAGHGCHGDGGCYGCDGGGNDCGGCHGRRHRKHRRHHRRGGCCGEVQQCCEPQCGNECGNGCVTEGQPQPHADDRMGSPSDDAPPPAPRDDDRPAPPGARPRANPAPSGTPAPRGSTMRDGGSVYRTVVFRR